MLIGGAGGDRIDGGSERRPDLRRQRRARPHDRRRHGNPRFRTLTGAGTGRSTARRPATAGDVLVTSRSQRDSGRRRRSGRTSASSCSTTTWRRRQPQQQLRQRLHRRRRRTTTRSSASSATTSIQGDGSIDLQRCGAYARSATARCRCSASVEAATRRRRLHRGQRRQRRDLRQPRPGRHHRRQLEPVQPDGRRTQRPDGADLIFGGAGTDIDAANDNGDTATRAMARDADMILGDNGNIYRIVGVRRAADGGAAYLAFNYDNDRLGSAMPSDRRRARRELLDYTPGGRSRRHAATAQRHRRGRRDPRRVRRRLHLRHGRQRRLFGEGQDDDIDRRLRQRLDLRRHRRRRRPRRRRPHLHQPQQPRREPLYGIAATDGADRRSSTTRATCSRR